VTARRRVHRRRFFNCPAKQGQGGPDDEVTASSLAVEMDTHLDTLVLVVAVAGCVLGWILIGPPK
jgi:hypothetical protein